jgi:hypothetical protein
MHAMHELNGGFSYQSLEIDRERKRGGREKQLFAFLRLFQHKIV